MSNVPTALKDIYATLTTDYGVRNYVIKYVSLFEEPIDDKNEAQFFSGMTMGVDSKKAERTKIGESVMGSVTELIRVFSLISPVRSTGTEQPDSPTLQRALHCYMFSKLYHLGLECRSLLETAPDFADHDGFEGYVGHLKKKHRLSEADSCVLALPWVDEVENICHSILQDNWRIAIFGPSESDGMCFLVRDKDGTTVVNSEGILCTERNLIISKYYFLVKIISILRNLELLTRITALEKGSAYVAEEIEITEIIEMAAFAATADAFFARLKLT